MSLPKPYYDESGIRIYCGDCREFIPLLGGGMDLIVTDPPYGFNRFDTDGKDYLESVGPALKFAYDALADGGSMFVFTGTGEVVKVANAVGHEVKRILWMYKPNDCTYPLKGWLLKSEAILWFGKGKTLNLHDRHPYRHDVYTITSVGQEGVNGHPTVKPLTVIKDLVSRCPEGGTVLDPFLGSGTTLRAAKEIGRKAIGLEIEEKYVEIAIRRLEQEVIQFPHDEKQDPIVQESLLETVSGDEIPVQDDVMSQVRPAIQKRKR